PFASSAPRPRRSPRSGMGTTLSSPLSMANGAERVSQVTATGARANDGIARTRCGIALEDGVRAAPAEIKKTDESETNCWYEVVLHEGRNQQIRRMFDAIGHSVIKLRRVRIGFLKDERLAPKQWRLLAPSEVARFMGRKQKEEHRRRRKRAAQVTAGGESKVK